MNHLTLKFSLKQAYILAVWVLFIGLSVVAGAADENKSVLNADDHPLVIQARKSISEGRFHEAVTLFSSALKICPTDGSILCGRGMAYEMVNQDEKAVQDYRRALEIDPVNYEAMENLAGIYEQRGNAVPQAVELYKRALTLDPRPVWKATLPVWIAILKTRLRPQTATAVGCWNQANAEAANGKIRKAEQLYSKAIKLDPLFCQAYFNRGLVRLKAADLQGALADFEETGNLEPFSRGWLVQRGIVHKRMGNLEKARDDLQQAVTLDPTDPLALYELAVTLEENKEFKAASELYQKALRLRPDPNLRRLIQTNKSKRESEDQQSSSVIDRILKLLE